MNFRKEFVVYKTSGYINNFYLFQRNNKVAQQIYAHKTDICRLIIIIKIVLIVPFHSHCVNV